MSKRFLILIFLAASVRFIGLDRLPLALNRDEAAIGYNAYSLLQSGKDEHSLSWPLNFQSIGDYKMPLYIYATILPVKLFGLNEFSIRFWSALAGIISVLAIYLITRNFWAGVLMALNPWAIFYSRIAFEANLALALFLVGLWLIMQKKFWGLIFWLLAILTYSSSLIFIPLFSLFLLPRLNKFFLTIFYVLVLIFAILIFPVSAQKSRVTIFSDPGTIDYYNQTRTKIYELNPLLARTWWNKNIFFGRKLAVNYFKTFSPQFLLTTGGGHPWHQIPHMGYFYAVEIFFALSGLIYIFKFRHPWRWWLTAWLLLAPLPSAITIDSPHATRSLYLLPIIIILAGFGLPAVVSAKARLAYILIGFYSFNLIYFSYQYLVNYPKFYQQNLPVGLKESLKFIQSSNITGSIYLTGIHDSAYLYPLVYTRFDPVKFQTEAVWTQPDTVGLNDAYRFGQFVVVDELKDVIDPSALILSGQFSSPQIPAFTSGNYQTFIY